MFKLFDELVNIVTLCFCSVRENNGSFSLDIADSSAILSDGNSCETSIAPGGAPRVLDQPVVQIHMRIVSETNYGHRTINRGLFCATLNSGNDSTLVKLEYFAACADACGNRAQFDSHFELIRIMR